MKNWLRVNGIVRFLALIATQLQNTEQSASKQCPPTPTQRTHLFATSPGQACTHLSAISSSPACTHMHAGIQANTKHTQFHKLKTSITHNLHTRNPGQHCTHSTAANASQHSTHLSATISSKSCHKNSLRELKPNMRTYMSLTMASQHLHTCVRTCP